MIAYGRETTIAPFAEKENFDQSTNTKDEKYFGSKDILSSPPKVNDIEGPVFVSTTTLTSIQNDDNQEEITEVLRTRKPSFIRRLPSVSVKSTTQRSISQSDYDSSRTKERNPVSIFQFQFIFP